GLRLASAGDLRAAARERLLDVDRPRIAERVRDRLVPVDFEAHLVAHLAEHGTAGRDADLVAPDQPIVGALEELEAADAELTLVVVVARVFDAQHLVLVDGVLDAGVEVD